MKQSSSFLIKTASWASILVAIILIICKLIAYFLTHSVAILSTLFDSIQDSTTSLINLITVHQSLSPADKKHRFGHGKAQGIGALIQSIIILISACYLIYTSVCRFFERKIPTQLESGIYLIIFAIILTTLLVSFQKYVIQKTNSLSIKADKAHYTGDILMNIGVLISLLCSTLFHIFWLDSVFGILVGGYLIKVSIDILSQSTEMLMDCEVSSQLRQQIKKTLLSLPEIHSIHNLKTRQSGHQLFIQAILTMNGNMTLSQAHHITEQAESLIHHLYPDSEILLHIEPDN